VFLVVPQDRENEPYATIPVPGARCAGENTPAYAWFPASQLADAFRAGFHAIEFTGAYSAARLTGPANALHVVMPAKDCDDEGLVRFMGGQLPEAAPDPRTAPSVPHADEPKSTHQQGDEPMAPAQEGTPDQTNPQPDERDPLELFMDRLADAQDKVREANGAVRDLKKCAKQLEREFKDREKDIRAREREFEKNARLIQQLQQTVAGEHRKAA
jgi:hypothetical protein